MAILDTILGGGGGDQENQQSSSDQRDFDSVIGTNPNLGFDASDILHSENSESDNGDMEHNSFTGIGDVGLDVGAPSVVGVSNSSSSQDWSMSDSDGDNGGLLGGLL